MTSTYSTVVFPSASAGSNAWHHGSKTFFVRLRYNGLGFGKRAALRTHARTRTLIAPFSTTRLKPEARTKRLGAGRCEQLVYVRDAAASRTEACTNERGDAKVSWASDKMQCMDGGIKYDSPLCHGAWALGAGLSSRWVCCATCELGDCELRPDIMSMHQKRGVIMKATDVADWPTKSCTPPPCTK